MKDCTTCKYGYEDEQLGFPMCHHPKRFSEYCLDFNLHEEKISKDLEEAANNYLDGVYGKMPHSDYHIAIFIAGAKWQKEQMIKNVTKWLKETDVNNLYISMFQRDMEDEK